MSGEAVAIVVPMHARAELHPEEEISLRHLEHFLGEYDRYMIFPDGVDADFPGFRIKHFGERYFGSAEANKRLMLSRHFYTAFRDYEFVLIYHLDALVFSDQLSEWCQAGLDYVGAPWLKDDDRPEEGFDRVGNGGLSLRRVESFLRVFDSPQHKTPPDDYWRKHHASKPWHGRLAALPKRYLKRLRWFNGVRREMRQYRNNEDKFWANRAQHYDPDFRIASVETGLRFAFERAPRYCFERNNRQLPFGCHAWARYDREFWEPHLLT